MLTGIGCVKKPKNWPAQSFTENKTAFALECHSAAFPRASRDRTHFCTHYHTRPPQARRTNSFPITPTRYFSRPTLSLPSQTLFLHTGFFSHSRHFLPSVS